jgi:hypothetical protein
LSCQVRIEAINKHRADINKCVGVRAIALLILDGAGWPSARLIGPDNIVFMPKVKI